MSLNKAMVRELKKERFDETKSDLIFPTLGVGGSGEYFYRVNDEPVQTAKNLITAEGFTHILNVAMGSQAKPTAYYLALFGGSAAPVATWTAANFAAVAGELTSQTEGYTNATRPVWQPTAATANSIDNMGGGGNDVSKAVKVTIATTSQVTITGAALLTAPAKGATTGALISAAKYPIARTLQNGDVFYIGYRLSLTE